MRTYPERPFSPSSLSAFAKSPLHYLHYCKSPFTQSLPMLEGNIFEGYLTGQPMGNIVPLVLPEPDKGMNIKANKDAFSTAIKCVNPVQISPKAYLCDNVYIVESSILDRLQTAADYVLGNLPTDMLFYIQHGLLQKKVTKDGLTGVADVICGNVGIDIKRYADASTANFERTFFAKTLSREALQVGTYCHLNGLSEFCFLICEPSEPFAFNIIKIDEDAIKWATKRTLDLLNVAKCWAAAGMESQGYFDTFIGYNSLTLPAWKQ